jgi:hypothetical protein
MVKVDLASENVSWTSDGDSAADQDEIPSEKHLAKKQT